MGLFKSTRLFYEVAGHEDRVAGSLMASLRYDGYEVDGIKMPSGNWDISVRKGNLFKAVLGLQTALKINISPAAPHVWVKAGIGIFGQQAIPTLLTTCLWWPFLIPQIWGIIQQINLDNIVMAYVQTAFNQEASRNVMSKVVD